MYNFKKEDTLLTVKFRLKDFIRQHNLIIMQNIAYLKNKRLSNGRSPS